MLFVKLVELGTSSTTPRLDLVCSMATLISLFSNITKGTESDRKHTRRKATYNVAIPQASTTTSNPNTIVGKSLRRTFRPRLQSSTRNWLTNIFQLSRACWLDRLETHGHRDHTRTISGSKGCEQSVKSWCCELWQTKTAVKVFKRINFFG